MTYDAVEFLIRDEVPSVFARFAFEQLEFVRLELFSEGRARQKQLEICDAYFPCVVVVELEREKPEGNRASSTSIDKNHHTISGGGLWSSLYDVLLSFLNTGVAQLQELS
jgi:hypothetical protein